MSSTKQVFISSPRSEEDAEWVRKLAAALENLDITAWRDEQIRAGESWRDAMEAGLRSSDAIIAILNADNVAKPWLLFELGVALGMGKPLIPIVAQDVDTSKIPIDIRLRRYLRKDDPEKIAQEVSAALTETGATN